MRFCYWYTGSDSCFSNRANGLYKDGFASPQAPRVETRISFHQARWCGCTAGDLPITPLHQTFCPLQPRPPILLLVPQSAQQTTTIDIKHTSDLDSPKASFRLLVSVTINSNLDESINYVCAIVSFIQDKYDGQPFCMVTSVANSVIPSSSVAAEMSGSCLVTYIHARNASANQVIPPPVAVSPEGNPAILATCSLTSCKVDRETGTTPIIWQM